MKKKIIYTNKAPKPIGPYNQAILHNDILYCSGQIAINPENNILEIESIGIETARVMKNIAAILEAAHMDFSHVLKCSIFLKDMRQYKEVNNIYASFLKNNHPAREAIQVSALPKNVNVEISVIASK